MPRADPTRSAYCASRHLLRNLDDAAELRRNPLVRACFAPGAGNALDAVRGLVHASLVRFREHPDNGRAHGGRGRMHAALLRCEIDKQPLAVVAAELGLSDRQVRRERRAAHDAFLCAFDRTASGAPPCAVVRDVASLRLAEASELHELAQSALATSACEAIASAAPDPLRRIEALCLAAEIDLDAARHAAAAARLAEANAVLALRALDLDDAARIAATEHIDFIAWSLRRETGVSAGLATPPPLAVAHAGDGERDEPRRALLVRALAAYAAQRWEVGDAVRVREAVRRAQELLPSLDPSRAKERLAVMYADAQSCGLRDAGADRDRFLAIEQIALRRGYVRTMLRARAERIGTEVGERGERVFEEMLRPLEPGDRRTMPCALADAARIAAQCERDLERGLSAAQLAERLVPPRSATALFSRLWRTKVAIAQGRIDDAWVLAQAVHDDAELLGNGRVRGSAACDLATIAFARRRRGEGERYMREALPLLERYGTHASLARVRALAKRTGLN